MIAHGFLWFLMVPYNWFHMISYKFLWFLIIPYDSYDYLWSFMIVNYYIWFHTIPYDFTKSRCWAVGIRWHITKIPWGGLQSARAVDNTTLCAIFCASQKPWGILDPGESPGRLPLGFRVFWETIRNHMKLIGNHIDMLSFARQCKQRAHTVDKRTESKFCTCGRQHVFGW